MSELCMATLLVEVCIAATLVLQRKSGEASSCVKFILSFMKMGTDLRVSGWIDTWRYQETFLSL
jgi:hypothetical protein